MNDYYTYRYNNNGNMYIYTPDVKIIVEGILDGVKDGIIDGDIVGACVCGTSPICKS